MSDVDFVFACEVTVRATVDALTTEGWSLEEPLGISYVVNDNGLYDWQSVARDCRDEVLTLLDEPGNAPYEVAVCIYHAATETGGQLFFFPGRKTCSFIPTINRRSLPTSPGFTDVGWYLCMLVPSLLPVGLQGYEARDVGY
ncbi:MULTISPECIES: hypothetical protein [unclassified Streptomyces]|uniref:hypothetical protein n=1 Tax=unclassified Streptomyces TaxID=2593676 RepID=UPI003D8AE2C9